MLPHAMAGINKNINKLICELYDSFWFFLQPNSLAYDFKHVIFFTLIWNNEIKLPFFSLVHEMKQFFLLTLFLFFQNSLFLSCSFGEFPMETEVKESFHCSLYLETKWNCSRKKKRCQKSNLAQYVIYDLVYQKLKEMKKIEFPIWNKFRQSTII